MECPNCINKTKCSGPHLIKVSDTVYKSVEGYFMTNNHNDWVWLPNDKQYDIDALFSIMDTLRNLNEKEDD